MFLSVAGMKKLAKLATDPTGINFRTLTQLVNAAFDDQPPTDDALERLREAESFVGAPINELFMDNLTGNPRQKWLDSVRRILLANGIEPENLDGRWHTKG